MNNLKLEKKLRDFLLNRVLPLITDELEEEYPLTSDLITREFVFNEKNYGAFLDQGFGTSCWTGSGKCKCTNKIIKDGGLNLLQLLIFIVKHNLDFADNGGYYGEGGCYLYLNKKTSINMSFHMHSTLLGSRLMTAVQSGFDYLKGEYCGKNYPPSDSNFNYEYWKIQAQLFFEDLPPLSNRGCSNKKPGITWNKECKDCVYFEKKNDYTCCGFDYDQYKNDYGRSAKVGFNIFLPDDGKTYACKHYQEEDKRRINSIKITTLSDDNQQL